MDSPEQPDKPKRGIDLARSFPATEEVETPPAVEEPPTATENEIEGRRKRRRRDRVPGARRRVFLALVAATALVSGTVLGTIWYYDRDQPVPETEVLAASGPGSSLLVLALDESGRSVSVGLLVEDGGGAASYVLFPPALFVVIPGFGDGQLGDASRFAGPELASLSVTNALGIRIDEVVAFRPGEVAELLPGPARVELPAPFLVEDDQGVLVAAAAGAAVYVPETVENLLVDQSTDNQVDWLQRQRAVWDSIFDVLAENGAAVGRFGESPAAAETLTAALSDPSLAVTVLPVSRIGAGAGAEFYTISTTAADVIDSRLGFLSLRSGDRSRVEILNGTAFVGVTQPVAAALVTDGFRVIKTDNADSTTYQESIVVAQGAGNQDAAEQAADVIGAEEVVIEAEPSGVVDVSIIIGADIAARER